MLFEKLTAKDCQIIENYIMTFGPNSEHNVRNNFNSLQYRLRHWDASKTEYLARLFDNHLILEKEIAIQEPISQISRQISHAMSDDTNPMFTLYRLMMEESSWTWEEYMALSPLFNSENLAKNRLLYLRTSVKFKYKGHVIKFNQGSKPIKAIGKLAALMGYKKEFEEFRLEHSRILNTKDLKGTLCLSIHPLDYMTMSDNASHWSSCMSWREDGCYRAGTIEMMNSPCVVVAYLKSAKEDLTWETGKWNNKHWRTLIIVTSDVIVNIKNYPYRHDDLTKVALQWLRQLAEERLHWHYLDKMCTLWSHSNVDIEELDHSVYFRPTTSVMYNDFDDGQPLAFISPHADTEIDICYSGIRNCMCCGDYLDIDGDDGESYVFCSDCSEHISYHSCECCNCIGAESEMYWVDGLPYCESCYEEYCAECALTHEMFNKNLLEKIYLTQTQDSPNKKTDKWIFAYEGYTNGWRDLWSWGSKKYFPADAEIHCVNGIYYLNVTDLTPAGLYDLYDISDVNSYINN